MTTPPTGFDQFDLAANVQAALKAVGYEAPTPIQSATIPPLLDGKDVIGQAQTGTGKTAAFALPILTALDNRRRHPQALVLVPTRELAIQVAEAFKTYAAKMTGFHVLPVYGGQDYKIQFRQLDRGVQVVVGTPGRIMDHMRRKTLTLDRLAHVVLDEADEMLRMGFADDVEWVMEHVPDECQVALFSATMPPRIRKMATNYLEDPVEIRIAQKTVTAESVRQRYWPVEGMHKLSALTRILEAEDFDAMIVFVRTKSMTEELATKLEARGFSATALSGDIPQRKREQTIEALKSKRLDILVATDVAARGLDVPRISHVVNYDIPYDTESYIHRIGRTGRAGKEGEAILFATPRERRMLRSIEQATGKKIAPMKLPSAAAVNKKRVEKFKQVLDQQLENPNLEELELLVQEYQQERGTSQQRTAAALAALAMGLDPRLDTTRKVAEVEKSPRKKHEDRKRERRDDRNTDSRRSGGKDAGKSGTRKSSGPAEGMVRYRLAVGVNHGVKVGNIVGAIANEADIESNYIDNVRIFEDYSTVDLPEGMPRALLKNLRKVWVSGQRLNISELKGANKSRADRSSPEGDSKPPLRLRKEKAGKAERKSDGPKKKPTSGKGKQAQGRRKKDSKNRSS